MKKLIPILIIALFLPYNAWAACTGTGTITCTASTSAADINTAISGASDGDTINIGAGSKTWNTTIALNKSISLIGAGIGVTNITAGTSPIINVYPAGSKLELIRISGFTFDLQGGQAINANGSYTNPMYSKFRIDNNRFTNSTYTGSVLENRYMLGVFDHNTIDDCQFIFRAWGQSGGTSEQAECFDQSPDFGDTQGNMYIEDNVITQDGDRLLSDGGEAGRYVFRYNTITVDTQNDSWEATFDLHDYQGGSDWSIVVAEIYGNKITYETGGTSNTLMKWRGGKMAFFYNSITASFSPPFNLYYPSPCPSGTGYDALMIHNNGIIFNNRYNDTGSFPSIGTGEQACGTINADDEYWKDASNYAADPLTTGIGCGTLANIPDACTSGVKYFATDQSCTNMSGLTGDITTYPSRLTITGTFYVCGSSNDWSEYYTPMTYPHPLVTGTVETPANAIQGVSISELKVTDNLTAWNRTDGLR
ncbi:MAG TPA: hypothetical protein VMW34_18630 [Anaerolineales bacterium]|nr:hypothetical protein [Anaerolineales bacterium]